MNPDYNITPQRSPHAQPSIPAVIADLLVHGVDRGSLVCRPTDGRPAALAVFLLSNRAIREVGPTISAHMATLRETHFNIQMDEVSSIEAVFERMRETDTPFAFAKPSEENCPLIAFFQGDHLTPKFCDRLTALGCPTRLH